MRRINGYYDFFVESVLGLYKALEGDGALAEKYCEIWYDGPYGEILSHFSQSNLILPGTAAALPPDLEVIRPPKPQFPGDWDDLRPLARYLAGTHEPQCSELGITLVRRSAKRTYQEHEELAELLPQMGLPVRVVSFECIPFSEQVALMRKTRILIGPHGAGLTNMMFMPPGGVVVELNPKGFIARCFKCMAESFSHRWMELESERPSEIGRAPSAAIETFLSLKTWPDRADCANWPNRMELHRFVRDVKSFSIHPNAVLSRVREVLNAPVG